MIHRRRFVACLLVFLGSGASEGRWGVVANAQERPNVLFIAVDDLNDWIGCLGGHPQTITPNFDRLAASGQLFRNAHCAAPACNPSRTAVMTGIAPYRSGVYDNRQKMRERLPDEVLLPRHFSDSGYWSAGSGKLLHYFIDQQSWDSYFPAKESENPFPRTLYPEKRPVSLPVGGPWQYRETDWAALDATDEEYGGDWLVSRWIGDQLGKVHEKPFFLACGIYRPHEPWFVPQKYFEPFALDSIQLPPGYLESDLDDLPPAGKQRGPNRYFDHIRRHGQWKNAIQGYLASIHFADAMLGRVLDALDEGPNRNNTIVVLWSDHGWHLGEKQHWQKFTGWRLCTRVPLMIRVPAGTPGLPEGTTAGAVCDASVNLLSLFPTLTELCGISAKPECDGPSLIPLLEEPNAEWPHASVTSMNRPKDFAISTRKWRLIHYRNGDLELYHTESDPYEWKNLAGDAQHLGQIESLMKFAPKDFEPFISVGNQPLPRLGFNLVGDSRATASRPEGNPFEVVFVNQRKESLELFWMNREGERRGYGTLEPGKRKAMQTRRGAVWMIANQEGKEVGHFVIGSRAALAPVPSLEKLERKD